MNQVPKRGYSALTVSSTVRKSNKKGGKKNTTKDKCIVWSSGIRERGGVSKRYETHSSGVGNNTSRGMHFL